MVNSLDGKVTGKFLYTPACEKAADYYYQINRDYQADAFACGRITMEEYPDLSEFVPAYSPMDCLVAPMVAEAGDKPLFMDSRMEHDSLEDVKYQGGALWMNDRRNAK